MNKIITGNEADIEAINHDAAVWENDIKAQLRHIISTAQSQLDDLDLTHDVLGNPFQQGENKINKYALDAIIACAKRIKELHS